MGHLNVQVYEEFFYASKPHFASLNSHMNGVTEYVLIDGTNFGVDHAHGVVPGSSWASINEYTGLITGMPTQTLCPQGAPTAEV